MDKTNWKPSDPLTVGVAAGVGVAVALLASITGQLESLGVHGLLGDVGVGAAVAAAILLQRLVRRRRTLWACLAAPIRALCTLRPIDLGIIPSSLARPLLGDGSAPYVSRDFDFSLTRLARDERVVVLTGPTGSGKTTAAFHLVRETFGDVPVLAPRERAGRHGSPGPLVTILDLTMRVPWRRKDYVLWLDDVGRSLDEGALDLAQLNRWLASSPGRRVIATLSSADQSRLEHAAGSVGRIARSLLSSAAVVEVPLDWTRAEQRRAQAAYPDLAEDAFPQFSRYLAYTPLFVNRLRGMQRSQSPGPALLRLVAHCHAVGITPVPVELINDLLPVYVRKNLADGTGEDELSRGLTWVRKRHGEDVLLESEAESGSPSYRLAPGTVELLCEQAGRPSERFWRILLKHRVAPWERVELAKAALLYGAVDIARAAVGALNRDKGADPAAQRAAGFLMLELTTQQQPEVGALLERASAGPPGIVASPQLPPGAPLGHLLPPRHQLLAWVNKHPLAKTFVRVLTLLVTDMISLWASLLVAYWTLDQAGWEDARHATDRRISFVVVVAVLLFSVGHLYRPWIRRPNFARLLAALTQLGCLLLILRIVAGPTLGSFSLVVLTIALAFVLLSFARFLHLRCAQALYRLALGRSPNRAVIGHRADVEQILRVGLESDSHKLVGWISCDDADGKIDGVECIGHIDDLTAVITMFNIDDLVLCSDKLDAAATTAIADAAWTGHADLRAIAPQRTFLITGSRYVPGEQLALDELRVPVLDATQRVIKRGFDVVLGTLGLVASAPIWLIIAVGVKLSSKGPVHYPVWRAGIGTQPFAMWRFRTVYLPARGVNTVSHTTFGNWLRLVGLDELPQLINVIKGDMSLVGPRPVAQQHFEKFEEWQLRRYLVPPGVTGLWQISGRQDRDYADMVRLDFYYVQRWSLFKDIEILLKSIPVSLGGRRARVVTEHVTDPGRELFERSPQTGAEGATG